MKLLTEYTHDYSFLEFVLRDHHPPDEITEALYEARRALFNKHPTAIQQYEALGWLMEAIRHAGQNPIHPPKTPVS